MKHIHTQIVIDAPATRVWRILTDFDAYPSWNPFIRAISGAGQQGSRLEVRIQPHGGKEMAFRPRILAFRPNEEFRWKGRLLMPGIFDGEHYFQLSERAEERTHLVHGEMFTGLLVPFVFGAIRRGTTLGFDAMNQALKARAEAGR